MDNIKIKTLIEGLLGQLGVKFDAVEIKEDGLTGRTVFIIKSSDSGLLIGERGETFQALSHLIKRMASKGPEESSIQFAIDVNDYQSSMVDRLKLKAIMLANRAKDLKSDVEMEPMTAYERLVIHGALTGEANIKTESAGEGKDRRVIIKYIA
ncbi:MAG: R3H domain-containing nucleic acid-binding protein [Candidatus Paceibacterota bacterium]|jgi:spoIIIJ-associated protein